MAKTFKTNPNRGKELFTYLKNFTDLRVRGVKDNPKLLHAEADAAMSRTPIKIAVCWGPRNYASMQQEVEKLSKGIVDKKAADFIENRKLLAATQRAAISSQYSIPSTLKARLSRVGTSDLARWMSKEARRSGRSILKQHLAELFTNSEPRQLTIATKRLLAAPRFRLSHTVVRADLYANWRTASSGSMSRDLLPDLDHVVTASYFDIYATKEAAQARYAPLILKKTSVAIYDGRVPVSQWLESL